MAACDFELVVDAVDTCRHTSLAPLAVRKQDLYPMGSSSESPRPPTGQRNCSPYCSTWTLDLGSKSPSTTILYRTLIETTDLL